MTSCRVWTGATNGNGYGVRKVQQRRVYIHREAWAKANGPIPDGLYVCHHCDNPTCYEVSHLFLGTQSDNMADARAKGRLSRHPRVLRGESCPTAKLSWSDVEEIRQLQREGTSMRSLGRRFGVSHTAIAMAVNGTTWRVAR